MKKVLFIASEADPFMKTGGLGDVMYALPKALKKLGLDVRVVIPKYKNIKKEYAQSLNFLKSFTVPVGWRNQYCGLFEYDLDGVRYYLLDNEYYFLRDNPYGHYDDGEKFAYFDRASLMFLKEIGWKPDIIHCNDWQTGMVPVLYNLQYKNDPFYTGIKTVYTIHNMAFQGNYDKGVLQDLFGLDNRAFEDGSLEFYGGVSFMKGGINYSDIVSTVSETYAVEIQSPEFGYKMDGLLRSRKNVLWGIVNGIDMDIYNPEKDGLIYKNFCPDSLEDKWENKTRLQRELGLEINKNIPLLAIVSRLTHQKGVDLIIKILDRLLEKNIELVVLGTGDNGIEEHFKYLNLKHPGRISANIMFDDKLAHRIYASSDIFLMPSLFEPCGLSQLIALRYGSIPVVRETGGLRDTIINYDSKTGKGNGFSFKGYDDNELLEAVQRALYLYEKKNIWRDIVNQAMNSDNSWEKSANNYINLYNSIA